jgi:PBSX family phage portal protein
LDVRLCAKTSTGIKMSLTIASPSKKAITPVKKLDGPKTTFVQKVLNGDTYLVLAKSAVEIEDEFTNLYFTTESTNNLFMQPPFEPTALINLVQTNNTLGQCIEVMEVNVDGTGHEFVKSDDKVEMDATELKNVKSLFDEPYPLHSFVKIRRRLRREVESVGYGYIEVLRNLGGDIMGFRNVSTHTVRMVKLDAPVLVTKKMMRGGVEVDMQMWERERRFAQRVSQSTMVYYREFGSSRKVSRSTGAWEKEGELLKPEEYATELLMIGLHPDVKSPYFVPRWVNQMPSVVGSRKAEEQNLEYFDSGGMPPAIIFVQGGTLATDASNQLKNYLSGKNKNKYRAVVVEAQSSSGSMESAGSVQIKVERFGGEKANDALYQVYDKNAEERVRMGFRIPPLFLGKAADYNFATAVTAYMVAEAQVFLPERKLFDELFNSTILKAMGVKTVKLKSKPITLKDVANQIQALTLAKDAITPESLIVNLNAVSGLNLEAKPPAPAGTPVGPGLVMGPAGHPIEAPVKPLSPAEEANIALTHAQAGALGAKAAVGDVKAPVVGKTPGASPARPMKKSAMELIELAQDYAGLQGLIQKNDLTEERKLLVKEEISGLESADLEALNSLVATYTFGATSPDLIEMVACGHGH